MIQICGELGRPGTTGQRQLSEWPLWLNIAQRQVCDRRLWSFTHDLRTVTIASGATSAPLGSTFRQLGQEQSPVSLQYSNYRLPVTIISRATLESAGVWPWQNPPFALTIPGGYMPAIVAFLETNEPGGQWTINLPPQYSVTDDLVFNISAYHYPADLALGNDHNAFTDDGNLGMAIINIAKALAYAAEETDGKKADVAQAQAERYIERALYADGQKEMGGVTARM